MSSSIDLGPPALPFSRQFIKSLRVSQPQPPENLNLTGQTGIITGGNSGIGFEASMTLLGYKLSHLIITTRDSRKGEDAVAKLKALHPTALIEAWPLDMLSYDSIRTFTQRCASLGRIDFAILNAATQHGEFVINESTKHELVFQVNYLSTVLLTLLLLLVLKEKRSQRKPGRVTIVSSGLAMTAKFPEQRADKIIPAFDDPSGWGWPAAAERYSTTKLLLLMFVIKLKDHVDPNEVVVNAADPGFMRGTGLDRGIPAYMKATYGLMRMVMGRGLKAGAWAYVDAAVVKPDATHGSWMYNWEVYS